MEWDRQTKHNRPKIPSDILSKDIPGWELSNTNDPSPPIHSGVFGPEQDPPITFE